MGKAIAGAVGVSAVLLGFGVVLAFITLIALNGFGERAGARIMMVIAAGFYAAYFFIVSRTARGLLPDAEKARGRTIGAVLTLAPALPTFGLLLMV